MATTKTRPDNKKQSLGAGRCGAALEDERLSWPQVLLKQPPPLSSPWTPLHSPTRRYSSAAQALSTATPSTAQHTPPSRLSSLLGGCGLPRRRAYQAPKCHFSLASHKYLAVCLLDPAPDHSQIHQPCKSVGSTCGLSFIKLFMRVANGTGSHLARSISSTSPYHFPGERGVYLAQPYRCRFHPSSSSSSHPRVAGSRPKSKLAR